MSEVKPFIDKLKSIESKLPEIAKQIIKENVNTILMLVKKRQLGLGLDSYGNDLDNPQSDTSPYYSPSTESFWAKQNPIPRRSKRAGSKYNFEWTGETMDKMYLAFEEPYSIEIASASGKAKYLESLYGEIFSLTEKHNDLINLTIIQPKLYEYVLKNMFIV